MLMWPLTSPDDLDIRTWPRYSDDVSGYEKLTFQVKIYNSPVLPLQRSPSPIIHTWWCRSSLFSVQGHILLTAGLLLHDMLRGTHSRFASGTLTHMILFVVNWKPTCSPYTWLIYVHLGYSMYTVCCKALLSTGWVAPSAASLGGGAPRVTPYRGWHLSEINKSDSDKQKR